MPPVLHVALDKLAGSSRSRCSRATSRCARSAPSRPAVGRGNRKRRSTDKIRARPDAAAERLVEQPAIEQQIHGAIGRGTCTASRMSSHRLRDFQQRLFKIGGCDSARVSSRACSGILRLAQKENDFRRCPPGRNSIDVCSAAHGSSPRRLFPKAMPPVRAPQDAAGVPLRPRNSVRSPVWTVCCPPRSAKAMRPPNSPSTRCAPR